MTQAAIAKRLAHIAMDYAGKVNSPYMSEEARAIHAAGMGALPAIGAALIRAGKQGVRVETLAHAGGCTQGAARRVLDAMESGGFAMQWGDRQEVWRLDTVQILAREERAALEALHAATTHEREAAAGAVAKRKKNAPSAQTGAKDD